MSNPNLFEHRYIALVDRVISEGEDRQTRAGPTKMLFGEKLFVANIWAEGFPIITNRRMWPRGIWGELAAFIKGFTRLCEFNDLGCSYWDANAAAWVQNLGIPKSQHRVGKIYGAQWRNFDGVDQLDDLVDNLIHDRWSRRHLLTTYNPSELDQACLPPCHLLAQFSVSDDLGLDCCVYMRSVDLCVGLPTDIVLYATLMELLGKKCGYYARNLTFMFGDTHVYKNHLDLWEIQRQRQPHTLPVLDLDEDTHLFTFNNTGIALDGYKHHDQIQYPFNV